MNKRVLVAMSGGVDSSVSAALLRDQGLDVSGVTMKLSPGVCCDIASALDVCGQLGIPHRILDAQDAFSRDIIENFISEYRHGRTPNPCVRCNDLVKFRLLLDFSLSNGYDYLATGHYARIEPDSVSKRLLLKKGIDGSKDQSYFLYRMSQEQMKRILFPLGGYRKQEVRSLAKKFNLPAAERPESQEVCFVPNDDYRAYLREHAPDTLKPGELVMTDGRVVGRHDGISFFTIGQRRKLGVAAGSRLYVVRIEPDTNRVVLGGLSELRTTEAVVSDVNVISVDQIPDGMRVTVKIRYRSPLVPATLEREGENRARIVFDHPVAGVCPGQAAVFYEGDTVVGGGIIQKHVHCK